jgi:tetratricopeptide (TPR) repeat protein
VLAEQQGDALQSRILAEEALELARHDGNEKELADAQRRLGQMLIVEGELQRGAGMLNEALSWHRSAADAFGAADVLRTLAEVAERQGDLDLARTFIEESVDFSRTVADERGVASGLFQLAFIALAEGDGDRAIELMEDAVNRWQRAQTTSMVAAAQAYLGSFIANHLGDDERAESLLAAALLFWREAGHDEIVANILDLLGQIAVRRGDHARAESYYREALALASKLPDAIARVGTSVRGHIGLGWAALARSESAQVLDHCRVGLECLREIPEDQWGSRGPEDDGLYAVAAACLRLVARATASEGDVERAVRVLGAAAALQAAAHFPLLHAERARADREERAIRKLVADSAFAGAFAEGEALAPRAAIADALNLARGPGA